MIQVDRQCPVRHGSPSFSRLALVREGRSHPAGAGERRLRLPDHHADRLQRRDQHQQVGVEDREIDDRELATDRQQAAHDHDDGRADAGQRLDRRVERRQAPVACQRLLEHGVAGAFEPAHLLRLASGRPDRRRAGDVLLHEAGQLADPLPEVGEDRSRRLPVADHRDHRQRGGRERQQRQQGIDHEHHDPGSQQGEDRRGQLRQVEAEEARDRDQVDRGQGHPLARRAPAQGRGIDGVQVGVQTRPQGVLDPQGQACRDDSACADDHAEREPEQGDPPGGQQRRREAAERHLVDREADQERQDDRAGDHQHREARDDRDLPRMRAQARRHQLFDGAGIGRTVAHRSEVAVRSQ